MDKQTAARLFGLLAESTGHRSFVETCLAEHGSISPYDVLSEFLGDEEYSKLTDQDKTLALRILGRSLEKRKLNALLSAYHKLTKTIADCVSCAVEDLAGHFHGFLDGSEEEVSR